MIESCKLFLLGLLLLKVNASTNDPNYGITWMYYPDGNNKPQIMYLDKQQIQTRMLNNDDIDQNVNFIIYTRTNKKAPKRFTIRRKREENHEIEENIEDIDRLFNPELPTKIYCHGWKSSSEAESLQRIKNNYLDKINCNVIAVDWRDLADNSFYFTPMAQTREVGRRIAEMIDELVRKKGANITNIHLIGHSLGAHTVGYAGSYTKTGRVGRITGNTV